MKIGSKKFSDKVAAAISVVFKRRDSDAYMSSNGEMKISLKLIICPTSKSATIASNV